MSTTQPTTESIYTYLERLANLLRAESWQQGKQHGLQPIQLQMLAYLQRCNRYSNTPLGVAEYFDLTKGTVSQSLNVLEEKGLVSKIGDHKDGRVVHLVVTARGGELLAQTLPLPLFQHAIQSWNEADRVQTAQTLQRLLTSLQGANQRRSFGVCATCRFHQVAGQSQYRCGLTQEPLSPQDIELICREHEPGLAEDGVRGE